MKQPIIKYLIIVLSIISFSQVYTQSCGFGCLGLSGVYGGYSVQQYQTDGLNGYLNFMLNPPWSSYYNPTDAKYNFKEGHGFKLGINLVRAQYEHFFFTFKGYYQFLSEEQNITRNTFDHFDAKLEMNNWGIGLDLGIPILNFVDWKIVEGELKFFTPKLTLKNYNDNPLANSVIIENLYTADKVKMGYSIGSGLIISIIRDYVSLEASGMYTFVEIDYLTNDEDGSSIPAQNNLDNNPLLLPGNKKLISAGGLQGLLQINIGIPL